MFLYFGLDQRLKNIEKLLRQIAENQQSNRGDLTAMQIDLTGLKAAVEKETTVTQSTLTLISGFGTQLADLKAQLEAQEADPATIAAIAELQQQIEADSSSLAAAVSANTPAA